ncbi:MAG: hypothetical protein K0Q87_5318 [Neobacillus sp.]|nr:hypothetical protein [Neobacillus sp.]
MLTFIAGLVVGTFSMLVVMSLMYSAKKGDQQVEAFVSESGY